MFPSPFAAAYNPKALCPPAHHGAPHPGAHLHRESIRPRSSFIPSERGIRWLFSSIMTSGPNVGLCDQRRAASLARGAQNWPRVGDVRSPMSRKCVYTIATSGLDGDPVQRQSGVSKPHQHRCVGDGGDDADQQPSSFELSEKGGRSQFKMNSTSQRLA